MRTDHHRTAKRARIGAVVGGVVLIGAGAIAGGLSMRSGVEAGAGAGAHEAAAETSFAIDLLHSTALFKIKHMNAANFYGWFTDFSGDYSIGETASLNVTVKATSVDTRNSKRDDHVTGPDFFSAKEFPNITFVAKGLKKGSGDTWSGSGDLTFRGVSKPVQLTLTQTGQGKNRDGKAISGVETRVTIKRSDFGSDYMIGPLSDEVEIIVALEGVSK